MDDKKQIRLQPHDTGTLLSEVIRAYMHGANPSALVSRMLVGIRTYQAETSFTAPKEDQELTTRLLEQLMYMYEEWRKLEDETYK
jgi:hypothetical protein